ncbi:hypothetical protein ACS0TY_014486 [Phlomoides rotata]
MQLSPDLREKHEKNGSNGTIPLSPQNEGGDLVVLAVHTLIRDVWILEKRGAAVVPSPDRPDPTSESKVGSTLDLTRIAPSILLRRDALRPIIPDNACILCLTAAAGTELADAYSPDTVIASSPGKEVHDPWAFYLPAALLRQAFAHCGKFPTAASRRSLGRVSVPVWLIILSDQLLIIALPFPAVVPLPRAGSYTLLTRPPLETPLPVRLACVKHSASVHPKLGSNSP